ncbi:MAG: phospholipid carrier-dependent glycosyltransferase, partial [Dehalococcoidia bacterium]
MKVLDRAQQRVALRLPLSIAIPSVLLLGLMAVAVFTRFWRLGTPDDFFFDEVYYAFTAREYLDGNKAAWEFFATPPEGFAYEWTHPPLAKLFMAGGMILLGENPLGWRFFGALAGVGAVLFTYLLGKKLFKSEIVALSAAFLLTVEGLLFVQSRLATADVYLVFFALGTLYFLVSDRYLLSGVFFGAALATKWSAGLIILPISFYFAYKYLLAEKANRSAIVLGAALILPCFYIVT